LSGPSFKLTEELTPEGVRRILLVNTATEEYISIIPEFGGTVSAIVLGRSGRLYSVLDGYRERKDFLEDDRYRGVHLIPFASRIENGQYSFRGRRFKLPLNDPAFRGAIHGFFRAEPLNLEEVAINEENITARFTAAYGGTVMGYPFPFEAALTFGLGRTDGFTCTVEIRNTGTGAMPLCIGWHPYFRLDGPVDTLRLELPVREQITLDRHMAPDGTRTDAGELSRGVPMSGMHFDGIYPLALTGVGRAVAKLTDTASLACLNLWQETGPQKFNYIVVYTPPDRRSVAIEPLTSNVDAFNNGEGLIVLEPGSVFSGSYGCYLT